MKNSRLQNAGFWLIAVILTIAFAYYQRISGPTYPIKNKVTIDNQEIKYKLLRTWGGEKDATLEFETPSLITGELTYKRYKSNDDWTIVPLIRNDNKLTATLPHQPPAGKIIYQITLLSGNSKYVLSKEPVVIRFKGDVPTVVLILHIIFIFGAMLLTIRTAFEAIFRRKNIFLFTKITLFFWLVGGMIFGPIMQEYAFGAFWTGWPFGHDLTDNKTLVALIFWIIAYFKLRKDPSNRTWPIIAAVVMLAVFFIPHSVLGSEIDYTQLPK
jgi:hypothetical protein